MPPGCDVVEVGGVVEVVEGDEGCVTGCHGPGSVTETVIAIFGSSVPFGRRLNPMPFTPVIVCV